MLKLRDYQQRAFEATLSSLQNGKNPVVSVPAGGGKSAVIAALVDRFRERSGYTLIAVHTKEIAQQNFNTLERYSHLDGVGMYCAGLDRYEIGSSATFCSIQSIYRNLDLLPYPDAVIVDEVHRVGHKTESAVMFNRLMARFPNARKIGVSATPFRLSGGKVYEGEGAHFDDLAYDVKVKDLVEQGYLAPLVGVSSVVQLDLKGVHKTNGDFDTKEVDERMTEKWLRQVAAKIKTLSVGRRAILCFTPTVRVAEIMANICNELGISSEYVHGGDGERDDRIARWERGEFTLMANCQILTTGYDRPDIDCIVDCSPTESLGLHIQKLGRGTRLSPGKKDCLIIDVAGNLSRLGGISSEADFDQELPSGKMAPGKVVKKKVKVAREVRRTNLIDVIDPMGGNSRAIEVNITGIQYRVIPSRKYPGKSILLCTYSGSSCDGTPITADCFICVEYQGYARRKAEEWFARRKLNYTPITAGTAKYEASKLPFPKKIMVQKSGQYLEIVSEQF